MALDVRTHEPHLALFAAESGLARSWRAFSTWRKACTAEPCSPARSASASSTPCSLSAGERRWLELVEVRTRPRGHRAGCGIQKGVVGRCRRKGSTRVDQFRIVGPTRLAGRVSAGGAKNAALPELAATLLTDEPVRLDGVPRVRDLETMRRLLAHLGQGSRRRTASWTDPRAERRAVRRRRALRAGQDDARERPGARSARGAPRPRPRLAAGRLRHRRAADRSAPGRARPRSAPR